MKAWSGVRHIASLIVVTLAVGVLPTPLDPALLGTRPCKPAESSHPENSREEQADAEPLKAFVSGRRPAQVAPTCAWLSLRVPRPSAPRPLLAWLSYEDPRRLLIPLRIDPPPDGLV